MLYDGEHIEIQKETEPKKFGGDIILGKNTQEISVPLNLLKNMHLYVGYPEPVKQILCFIYVIHYGKNVMFHF